MNRVKQIPLWLVYGLLAYMPLHVFLSQSLSLVTGGLSVWKVAKDVVVCAAALGLIIWAWKKVGRQSRLRMLAALIVGYAALHGIIYLLLRDTSFGVAALASVYNVRPFLLLLIGVCAALLLSKVSGPTVFRLAVTISSVIAALGILQYFLPADFLTHLGYSDARGAKPSFLIDNKADLVRVMSTLREPNSFGAFLVLPMLALTAKLFRGGNRMLFGGLFALHGLALLLTFSRSAWLALILGELTLVALLYRNKIKLIVKRFWIIGIVLLLFAGGGIFALRDQYFVQNVVFHADENTVDDGSSEKHFDSIEMGSEAIAQHPWGHGPGTAGPVSMHTDKPFITENYYLQLGYEVGVLGLILFVVICAIVILLLMAVPGWQSKVLIAAFVGYAICNFFLHTWANEAVATQWWLLAGVVIATSARKEQKEGIVKISKLKRRSSK